MAGYFGLSYGRPTALEQALDAQGALDAVTVTGRVKMVTETAYGVQVQCDTDQVLGEQQVLEAHDVILREDQKQESSLLLSLQPGNRICVTGDIRPFSAPTNPGEFDQKNYYRMQSIDAVMDVETCQILDGRSDWLAQKLQRLTAEIQRGIRNVSADEGEYGLYLALLLGDKQAMEDETRVLFQHGGIAHLLAISGLHLSLMGMGIWKLLRRMSIPLIPAGMAASGLLLLYVILIGGGASAWRAWIMFSVMLLGGMLGRTYDLLSALGLAGILLLWEQPMFAMQAGFQLSFGAMVGIGAVDPVLQAWWEAGTKGGKKSAKEKAYLRRIGRSLVGSMAIQLVTLPITAYHFYQIPVYGIFLNLLAIPLMTYALSSVLLGTFLGMIWPVGGVFLAGTAHYLFGFLEELCRWVEAMPGAVWVTGRPAPGRMVGYYVMLIGLLVWLNRLFRRGEKGKKRVRQKQRLLGKGALFAVYLLFLAFLFPIPEHSLRITMLDVGQGDGIVLQLPDGRTCLNDGGSSSVAEVGEKRILPFLKYEGIQELAMIFLTHEDADHINGIAQILADPVMDIGGIAIPAVGMDPEAWTEIFSLAEVRNIPIYRLSAGDVWSSAGVNLKVLHPSGEYLGENANSTSLVLELAYRDFRALFMGDLETEQELALLRDFSDIDLLKVGHHGAGGATCAEFLEVTRPELALISCGKKNRYGHPHAETLARLDEVKAKTMVTAESGAIRVEYGETVILSTWREKTCGKSSLLAILSFP